MKSSFLFFLVFITANNLYAQTKSPVPGAQVQPQWVFPIWFEDGNGDRDTIYFCYDPDANNLYVPSSDTVFGEYWVEKDSTKFWVGLDGAPPISHVTLNAYVSNNPSNCLAINKGAYPLKMYWDVGLLNSPDLPFADNSPRPRARIDIFCDDLFRNCPWDRGIVIHGDSLLHGSNYFPTYKDSMVFHGDPNAPVGFTLGNFCLTLKNYNDPLPVGVSKIEASNYVLYPNPVKDFLIVNLPETRTSSIEWTICDYTGAPLQYGIEVANLEKLHISTQELKSGYYTLRLFINGHFITKPFIKQ